MEHQIKREPQFWINPNFRLNSPWNFLSQLLGEDARTQEEAMDIVLSKYWFQMKFLMK